MQLRTVLVVAFAGLALAVPKGNDDSGPTPIQLKRIKDQERVGLSCSPSTQGTYYCTDFQGGDCFINRDGGGTCIF